MTTAPQILALVTAGLAGAVSAFNWRKARSGAARRSSLAGIFSSLAILLVVVPNLVLPRTPVAAFGAATLSIGLSLATFAITIRSSRERGSTR